MKVISIFFILFFSIFAFYFSYFYNFEKHKPFFENEFNRLGYKIRIEGKIEVGYLPFPNLKINNVYLYDLKGFQDKEVVHAKKITINPSIKSFLFGELIVNNIELDKSTIYLNRVYKKNKKDKVRVSENKEFGSGENSQNKKNNSTLEKEKYFNNFKLRIKKISISNSNLIYGEELFSDKFNDVNIDINSLENNKYKINGFTKHNSHNIDVEILASIEKDNISYLGNLRGYGFSSEINGKYSIRNNLKLNIVGVLNDSSLLLKTFKLKNTKLPKIKFNLETKLNYNQEKLNLLINIKDFTTGTSKLNGKINITDKVINIAEIRSKKIDLNDFKVFNKINLNYNNIKKIPSKDLQIEDESFNKKNNLTNLKKTIKEKNKLSFLKGDISLILDLVVFEDYIFKKSNILFSFYKGTFFLKNITSVLPGDTQLEIKSDFKNEKVNGIIKVNSANLKDIFYLTGIDTSTLRSDKLNTLNLDLRYEIINNKIYFNDKIFKIDNSLLNINGTIDKKNYIDLNISLDELDIDSYIFLNKKFINKTANISSYKKKEELSSYVKKKKLDNKILVKKSLFDINTTINAKSIIYKKTKFINFHLKTTLKNKLLTVNEITTKLSNKGRLYGKGEIMLPLVMKSYEGEINFDNIDREIFFIDKKYINFIENINNINGKIVFKSKGAKLFYSLNIKNLFFEVINNAEYDFFLNSYKGFAKVKINNINNFADFLNNEELVFSTKIISKNEYLDFPDLSIVSNFSNASGSAKYYHKKAIPFVDVNLHTNLLDLNRLIIFNKKNEDNFKSIEYSKKKLAVSKSKKLPYSKSTSKLLVEKKESILDRFFRIGLNANLFISDLTYLKKEYKNIKFDIYSEGGIADIGLISSNFLGGKLESSAKITRELTYKMKMSILDGTITDLTNFIDVSFLSGNFNTEIDILSNGNNFYDIITNSKGFINLELADGYIYTFNTKVLNANKMDIFSLFAFKKFKESLFSGEVPYENINLDFKLKDGILMLNKTNVDLLDNNIVLSGDIDLTSKLVDIDVVIDFVKIDFPFINYKVKGPIDNLENSFSDEFITRFSNLESIKSNIKKVVKGNNIQFNRALDRILDNIDKKTIDNTGESLEKKFNGLIDDLLNN